MEDFSYGISSKGKLYACLVAVVMEIMPIQRR